MTRPSRLDSLAAERFTFSSNPSIGRRVYAELRDDVRAERPVALATVFEGPNAGGEAAG